MVLPASDRIPRAPSYSGRDPGRSLGFIYGAITLFGRPFQCRSITARLFTPGWLHNASTDLALNPDPTTVVALSIESVWTLPRSLAATEGIPSGFFSCGY